jgi:murein tripeptide amidase MpaA
MTGATHSRELITIQMVMFQLAKLIQTGVINKDPVAVQQLLNNKFLFIPVVNVDGLFDIEANNRYRAVSYEGGSSAILPRRKNLNDNGGTERSTANCEMGVDLNRNYAVDWKLNDMTEESKNPCSEFFAGLGSFSEPET